LQHGHGFQPPAAADRNYFCGQCGKELTVQMSSKQEIVLSANCSCSGKVDVDRTVDGIISSDEVSSVLQSTVNASQFESSAGKVELPEELMNP